VDEARARGDGRTVAERLSELADALLQLERMSEAEAVAREAVSLVDASGWRSLELVLPHAIAAEIFARIGTADAEAALTAAEQFAEQQDDGLARPALLRARGLFEVARGRRSAGLSALEASATQARAQGALIQLGRTLSAFRLVVRAGGDSTFLSATENELIQVVQRIGPEVQRLPWAAVRQVVVPPRIGKSAEVGPVAVLTRREREVAALVAQGLTDRQIADALVITEGTVGVHLGHILNKLGFHSRAQLAAWATQHRVAAGAATLTTRDSGC
jgi:DNA-binding NarL/FixJ family response regulator